MSRAKFKIDLSDRDIARAVDVIADWLDRNPSVPVIEIDRIAEEVSSTSADLIAIAIRELVYKDILRRVFKVKPPTQPTFLDQNFSSLDEIFNFEKDGQLVDTYSNTFTLDDANIIPAYVVVGEEHDDYH